MVSAAEAMAPLQQDCSEKRTQDLPRRLDLLVAISRGATSVALVGARRRLPALGEVVVAAFTILADELGGWHGRSHGLEVRNPVEPARSLRRLFLAEKTVIKVRFDDSTRGSMMRRKGVLNSLPFLSGTRTGVTPIGRFGAGGMVLLMALAGCSGQGEKAPPPPPAGGQSQGGQQAVKVIASQPMAHRSGPVKVDLLSVDRSAASTVTVRWRLNNSGQQDVDPAGSMETLGFHPESTVDGITLVDVLGHKRYFPLRTTSNGCLCSSAANAKIRPGASGEFYAVFPAPPADLRSIAVAVPLTPAFLDVPIGSSPRPVAAGEADPAKTQVKTPPPIVPLISTVEGTDESVDEDADNRSVRLSADVLFAVNKADLTSKAPGVLQKTAQQIDASPGSTIKVDGYTDTTGTDAINNPLSERRAQTVADRLKGLVTRQGVTFQPAGHGSKDPVADNGTDAGRRKNRRVTVTFPRPKPVPPQQAPQTPPPAAQWTGGKLPVVAVVQPAPIPNRLDTRNLKLEINGLHRDPNGIVQLAWTLTNNGTNDLGVSLWFKGDLFTYAGEDTSGAVLVDEPNKLRYNPLRDQSKGCLCTVTNNGKNTLKNGESVTFFDLYEIPADVTAIAVNIPGFAGSQRLQIQ
jgi:outer membrane protein OmpA-like peptidoglycan-associated protein